MVRLRPHHGLCIKKFVGKGYSDRFIANMKQIIQRLEKEPIQLILKEDEVCAYCPHHKGECETKDKVMRYDRGCLESCGLEEGVVLDFSEYSALIEEKLHKTGQWKVLCSDCEWYSLCHGE